MMKSNDPQDFPLGKKNFMIIGIGVLVATIGFFLMSGGGSDDPAVFNPDVFSFRRISLAPVMILAGYGAVMYGIIKKWPD